LKRTAEKILSIIAAVFTGMSIIFSFAGLSMIKGFSADEGLQEDFRTDLLSDPALTTEDVDMILFFIDALEGFSWFLIVVLFISFITTIIGIIFIWNNKKPKLSGIMFIIAGLFAFILSPTSILLYIAGILCFTRKSTLKSEPGYEEDGFGNSMRPL